MAQEKFSQEYRDYRTGLAEDIRDATWPFIDDSVGNRGQAETRVSDTQITIYESRYNIEVRYVVPDSDPAYQRVHSFSFGYGDGDYLSYLTQRLNSLRSPVLLNSVEAIAEDEAAMSELAWMSTAILSSHLARRRQYSDEEIPQPPALRSEPEAD